MIISASRRTDIPAFYSEWFLNRVSEGYVLLKNPFNAHQIRRVSLRPEDVDLIVFWTRNADKLMPSLRQLDTRGYRYYFQYTINSYPRSVEKSVPGPQRAIQTFIELSNLIGARKVIWRYDPILVSNLSSIGEHKRVFEKIARALTGSTERVVISFVDMYKRVSANIGQVPGLSVDKEFANSDAVFDLAQHISDVAKQCGMSIQSCAEEIDLEQQGIMHGKCIDDNLIRSLYSISVSAKKDKNQRLPCGCVESVDIGQYDTCLHGCQYCYATTNHLQATKNFEKHNPKSPLLIGEPCRAVTSRPTQGNPEQETLF
ncbi:MAG: hypothetical protein C3F18_12375 [Nitrosomonadales bacterium]|nr:MAG: hypothetical protein C3F18_12375 [Nitrosomonadales bacterium]